MCAPSDQLGTGVLPGTRDSVPTLPNVPITLNSRVMHSNMKVGWAQEERKHQTYMVYEEHGKNVYGCIA